MKKLNKFLMSVVGLSTIAATAIPLAACSKKYTDGVEVTAKEWTDALTYLSAYVKGATWQSSKDDAFDATIYTEDGKIEGTMGFTNIAFNDDLASAVIYFNDLCSNNVGTAEFVSIARSNMYFAYDKLSSETKWNPGGIQTMSVFQQFFIYVIGTAGEKSDFTYDTKNKAYIFNGSVEYKSLKGTSNVCIRFDSDKKITFMKYNTNLFEGEKPALTLNLTLHPQYSNVKVNVPDELKSRADAHVFEMTSKTTNITLPSNKEDGIIVNITSDGSYTKLSAKDDRTSAGYPCVEAIFLNDKLLVVGEDYQKSIETNSTTEIITFKNITIKKGDKLNVAFSDVDDEKSKTLTLTLA